MEGSRGGSLQVYVHVNPTQVSDFLRCECICLGGMRCCSVGELGLLSAQEAPD